MSRRTERSLTVTPRSHLRKLSDYRIPNKASLHMSTLDTTILTRRDARSNFRSLPRRNKIFTNTMCSFEHFSVGVNMANIDFQDLQPFFGGSDLCGCQDSLKSCSRLQSLTNLNKTREMRKRYAMLKELRYGYTSNRKDFPRNYPEILHPHVQNLLQLIQIEHQHQLTILLHILVHAKTEYLTFWLYNDLINSSNDKENFYEEVAQTITNHSMDLSNYIDESGFDLMRLTSNFQEMRGTNIIPSKNYAQYLENLQAEGKKYNSRLVFVFLLFCKKKVKQCVKLQNIIESEKTLEEFPWTKIFEAAKNKVLK